MLSKVEIFESIQEIIRRDYAGFQSKAHLNNPGQYKVSDEMSDWNVNTFLNKYYKV